MDSNTILSLITELQTDPGKFEKERIAEPATRKQVADLLKEEGISLHAGPAYMVFQLQADMTDRVPSLDYAKSFLKHPQVQTIVKHQKVLFSDKTDDKKQEVLGKLTRLESEDIEKLVKAIRRMEVPKTKKLVPPLAKQICALLDLRGSLAFDDLHAVLSKDKEISSASLKRSLIGLVGCGKVNVVQSHNEKRYMTTSNAS